MKINYKKPGHFEIEAWGMLLFFAILIVGLLGVAKCLPYYWKYKIDKQPVQQVNLQHQTVSQPNKTN
jgi:hypothetical protein